MAEREQVGGGQLKRPGQAGDASLAKDATERILAMTLSLRERFLAMPSGKRAWLVTSLAFLLAASAGFAWYAERPDWRLLFSGLDGKDMQQVSQELAAAGIPYTTTEDGAGVQVPAEMLDKARMEVASKGMPQTGRLGFELFDKPNWVGSEFDERVNYQRALEGELEHTIGTLGVVKSARVHLVLPSPSLFTAEEKTAKASVVLKLKRPFVDPEQVEAIRSLVAGSVENLSPGQVTLVDADGRMNFKKPTDNAVQADVEEAMETKLVSMLEPLAGRDNVRATVNLTYDEGSEERTDEVYDPNQVAALSTQKSEQISTGRGSPSGVPGTASNSPAGSPAGAIAGSQAAAAPGTPPLLQKPGLPVYPQANPSQGQSFHQENDTYGVTKHLVHTEQGPGRVRRVSAAVVVNDRNVMEGEGKAEHLVWKPRNAEEMRRLEELAQAAVGYDARRGDQVVIENVSFSTNSSAVKPQAVDRAMEELRGLAGSQPGLIHTLMIGLCALLLVIFVLRPVATQVTSTLREPLLLSSGVANDSGPTEDRAEMLFAEPSAADDAVITRMNRPYQLQHGIVEHVSEHIRREPNQSTRLLEAWIGSAEGEN
jgi:flagellar M-ring protein FliF